MTRKTYNFEASDDAQSRSFSFQKSRQVSILCPGVNHRHKWAETVRVTEERQDIFVVESCACF